MRSVSNRVWSAASLTAIFNLFYLFPFATHAQVIPQDKEEYVFDSALFQGASINKNALLRLSKGENVAPGVYKVDLYVNSQFIEKMTINFTETASNKVQPCFTLEQLNRASIITNALHDGKHSTPSDQCAEISSYVEHASSSFDLSRLKLDLSIPQGSLKQIPRGYVAPEQLNTGESIGFINYLGNYYYSKYDIADSSTSQDSIYLSLNGGINFGKWQFRQQSSITNNENGTKWNNIRSYIKRPITELQSELSIGQLSSTARFFSGLSFNGINLRSDERMLPDSMRGYAPVIQGIAKTTAKVSIQQNGREIYQTTVAPGPFKISDLYPTNYNGDLLVTVSEADGTRSEFKVPFSAVPESVRQGAFKYNLDIGLTRNIGEDTNFANITTQYGLNNAITLNNGFRIAEGYQSAMLGTAYTNFLGAFGTEVTYSRSKLLDNKYIDGWMFGANYSKTFQATNTTIALAGYRFSTEGYRDLADIISIRQSIKDGTTFQSNTYNERSRATLVLNQTFSTLGTFYLSGSASQYRDAKPDDYQIQLGYGKVFNNGVSLNISVARQKSIYQNNQYMTYRNDGGTPPNIFNGDNETTYGLSVSIPFGKSRSSKDVQFNYLKNRNQNNYQASINGSVDRIDNLNYNLGVSYDDHSNISVFNAGVNKRFNNIYTSINASKSDHYWQTSANVQGALAIHGGGVTFGPYLNDTFALIEAKGAEGAKVLNAQGAKINKSGFALVPSLMPYRYNTISINPEGMSTTVELESGDTQIAPYSGSAVKVNFNTRHGYAMLIKSKISTGDAIPLGSDVFNEKMENIGMSGQNGQIYLRTDKTSGQLHIKWGNEKTDACVIRYHLSDEQLKNPLIRLTESCAMEQ